MKTKSAYMKIPLYLTSFIVTALLLAACGGGGVTPAATPFGTKQMGVVGNVTGANATAIDANGNIYVAGYTRGSLDGNTLMGINDFFLSKYDASGNKIYTKQMGVATKNTTAYSAATDVNGNVYVTGVTYGGLDGNTMQGTADYFLTKYDATGTKLFTKQVGVPGRFTTGNSTATDANGNVYVAGYTSGSLDGNTLMGTGDFFITKYNSTGTRLYTKQVGVAGSTTGADSTAIDTNGNVYVTGDTTGGLDGNTLTGMFDFFLTKFDTTGTKLYTKQMGVVGKIVKGYSTATDTNGNVYVTGYTNGGLDGNILKGMNDFFLTKYDATGTKLYTRQLGVAGKATSPSSVTVDASGNVYVTGDTTGGLDGNTLTGIEDIFLTKYDATGTKLYTKQLGLAGKSIYAGSSTTDTNGNVYLTGQTDGGLDGNTLTGTNDFFLMKYNSAGIKQ